MPHFRLCLSAKRSKSSRRAMVPSSLRISTITEAGSRPAKRARSQPASVWPARISTPPGCAINGKMCPGWTISAGLASAATASKTVLARSAAEIPVVTPLAASIETVKLVPLASLLWLTISGRFNCLQRSCVSVRQINPRPWVAIKLISSLVTVAAGMIKSPSFSRSSSSIKMIIFPFR